MLVRELIEQLLHEKMDDTVYVLSKYWKYNAHACQESVFMDGIQADNNGVYIVPRGLSE